MHFVQDSGICVRESSAEERCWGGLRSFVKDADREIIAAMKAAGRLVDAQSITHSYPFCWRSETPLIYKVRAAISMWRRLEF